ERTLDCRVTRIKLTRIPVVLIEHRPCKRETPILIRLILGHEIDTHELDRILDIVPRTYEDICRVLLIGRTIGGMDNAEWQWANCSRHTCTNCSRCWSVKSTRH